MKKNKAIVFGITSDLAFALGTTLISLKKTNSHFSYDIIIYHDTALSIKNKKALLRIAPCLFIKYQFPLSTKIFSKKSWYQKYSSFALSRYECFSLLKYYKKILWLDVDIHINGNIEPLFDYGPMAMALDMIDPLLHKHFMTSRKEKTFGIYPKKQLYNIPLKEMFMPGTAPEPLKNTPHYNTGVILLTDEIPNWQKMRSWCYKKTYQYRDIIVCPCQIIINILIQEFKLNCQVLDYKKYNWQPIWGRSSAVILHTKGSKNDMKFWGMVYHKNWSENYKEWLALGGQSTKKINNFAQKLQINLDINTNLYVIYIYCKSLKIILYRYLKKVV